MSEQNPSTNVESKNWFIRLMETNPLLIRAVLVALAAIVSQVVKSNVDFEKWVDAIINAFSAISALVLAYWARPSITPKAAVLAYRTTDGEIVPGPATPVDPQEREAAIDAITAEG